MLRTHGAQSVFQSHQSTSVSGPSVRETPRILPVDTIDMSALSISASASQISDGSDVEDDRTISGGPSYISRIASQMEEVSGIDLTVGPGEVRPAGDKQIPFQINVTLARSDIIAFDIKVSDNSNIGENRYVINRMQQMVALKAVNTPHPYNGREKDRANFSIKGEVLQSESVGIPEFVGEAQYVGRGPSVPSIKLECKSESNRDDLWNYLGLDNIPSKAAKGIGENSNFIIFYITQDHSKQDNIKSVATTTQ